MKKTLVTSLIAAPLLTLSSLAFAAEPQTGGPMLLTEGQMDQVTAGHITFDPSFWLAFSYKHAEVAQINVSPVTIVQIGSSNTAVVYSGNFSVINQ